MEFSINLLDVNINGNLIEKPIFIVDTLEKLLNIIEISYKSINKPNRVSIKVENQTLSYAYINLNDMKKIFSIYECKEDCKDSVKKM